MPKTTISTQEFQQKLQAGKIQDALLMLVRNVSELDVTTRSADEAEVFGSEVGSSSEYLRTRIDLLTGVVENEVSKGIVADDNRYLKLQQLHEDRIVTSHWIVQSYLQQLRSILTVLSPSSSLTSAPPATDVAAAQLAHRSSTSDLNFTPLVAKLTQANTQMPIDPPTPSAGSTIDSYPELTARQHLLVSNSPDLPDLIQTPPLMNNTIERNIYEHNRSLIYTVGVDDELDLSVDETAEVWEEWVEDADFIAKTDILPPPAIEPTLMMFDREDSWVSRQLNPIDVKPITHRATESVTPEAKWGKFGPEYIGIGSDPQPSFSNSIDVDRMDRLLADLLDI